MLKITTLSLGLVASIAMLPSQSQAEVLHNIGSATVTKNKYSCNAGKDICYDINITCAGVGLPLKATIFTRKAPAGIPDLGTITFHSEAAGTSLWTDASTYAEAALSDLNSMGYRTVQIKWASEWYKGSAATAEGFSMLACRPATLINWINTNFKSPGKPLCSTGNSAGSIQIAYSLSDYGLSAIISNAVLTGGPGVGRIDSGCYETGTPLSFGDNGGIVDKTYGFKSKQGPCSLKTSGYSSKFQADSISLGDRTYYFPNTSVAIYVGAFDNVLPTIAQTQLFFDKLVAAASPMASMETLPDTGHSVHATNEGVNKIKTALINGCVLHPN